MLCCRSVGVAPLFEVVERALACLREVVADSLDEESVVVDALEEAAVRHHPAVDVATGVRGDEGRELDVALDPLVLGVEAAEAGLRIEWRPRPDPAERAHFVFQYDDSTGRDFGWHREPNPRVEGLTHVQVREQADDEYEYRADSLDADSPVELLWMVLGRVEACLSGESREG